MGSFPYVFVVWEVSLFVGLVMVFLSNSDGLVFVLAYFIIIP